MKLGLQPLALAAANAFVKQHHRHHGPVLGYKFAIGCTHGEQLVGVVIVGRPVARMLDNGWTAEVTRLCTNGTPHVASMLYAAAWRAARAMGYRRLITYTLASEPGISLKAAGWRFLGVRGGGSWDHPGRPRVDKHPVERKNLWEVCAGKEGHRLQEQGDSGVCAGSGGR